MFYPSKGSRVKGGLPLCRLKVVGGPLQNISVGRAFLHRASRSILVRYDQVASQMSSFNFFLDRCFFVCEYFDMLCGMLFELWI
uniref:Uncharacterized protein n=1 Tax=Pseudomonas syringae pv. actinidiae TaxID=103796 RepID=A0A7D5H513_PSESF|nr:hypothetical protein [Pseudomonas syringae pv. actinidiae]QKZ25930.1 hypothetical protein [Pseudomonas syringae pv. actinidiae]QKZ25954.1 hypothetical protein [Pseudomonas syringae pv. actinidiae]QKZ26045.1 hypothetical protein [Pseudomonas syringae pv. actinidiae]